MIETTIIANECDYESLLPLKGAKKLFTNKEKNIFDLIASENWDKLKNTLKKPAVFQKLFGSKQSATYSSKCYDDQNILLFACKFNPPFDIVKFLVKLNPQATHEKDYKGRYALHIACKYGCDYKIIQFLLKSNPGAVKKIDIDCRSPYLLACRSYVKKSRWSSATNDLLKILKDFDRLDASIHALEDKDGVTPLEYAVEEELSMKVITYIQQKIQDRRNEVQERNDILSKSERSRLDIMELCMRKNYVLPKEYSLGTSVSSMSSLILTNQTIGKTVEQKQVKTHGLKENDRITHRYTANTPIIINKMA